MPDIPIYPSKTVWTSILKNLPDIPIFPSKKLLHNHALNKKSMSMTESKFSYLFYILLLHPLCRSSGFEILVGPFPSNLRPDLCALQLLFMVDATRSHAGRTAVGVDSAAATT